MEAIKCPNCGSEKVQELTEEKYVCLACDNVFLIHNLSKEFKKTDEHISEVHKDLINKLDSIEDMTEDKTSLKNLLFDAEQCLEQEDYVTAYDMFKRYSKLKPDSYIGYEGMYRAVTLDYDCMFFADSDEDEPQKIIAKASQGFDVLKKALNCKDCDKEELTSKVLIYYRKITKGMLADDFYGDLEFNEIFETTGTDFNNLIPEITESIKNIEDDNVQIKDAIEKNSAELKAFEELSDKEKNIRKYKKFLPATVTMLITLILFISHAGLLLKIVLIIVDIFLLTHVVDTVPINQFDEYNEKIESNNSLIEYGKALIVEIEKIDKLQNSDMENIINQGSGKYFSAEMLYSDLVEHEAEKQRKLEEEAQLQAELEEGYFQVVLTNWGSSPSSVKNVVEKYVPNKKWVSEIYKHREQSTIHSIRKSTAYALQEEIIQRGGTAYVQKM